MHLNIENKMFRWLHREDNALCIPVSLSISLYHFLIYANFWSMLIPASLSIEIDSANLQQWNLLSALSVNVSTWAPQRQLNEAVSEACSICEASVRFRGAHKLHRETEITTDGWKEVNWQEALFIWSRRFNWPGWNKSEFKKKKQQQIEEILPASHLSLGAATKTWAPY